MNFCGNNLRRATLMIAVAAAAGCSTNDWQVLRVQHSGEPPFVASLSFAGRGNVWAALSIGAIERSDNDGRSWLEVESMCCEPLLAGIQFQNERPGFAFGSRVIAGERVAAIWRTRDGVEWRTETVPHSNEPVIAMADCSPLLAVALVSSQIWKNVGDNVWSLSLELSASRSRITHLACTSASAAVALTSKNELMISGESANAWNVKTVLPGEWNADVRSLSASETSLWITGAGGLLARLDNGADAWTRVDTRTHETLTALRFRGPEAWAVGFGGVGLHSVDGGVTWSGLTIGRDIDWMTLAVSSDGTWLAGGTSYAIARRQSQF